VTGKRIAVLGSAFKADTNDTREAPALRICQDLLEEGAQLAIFDSKVGEAQMAIDLGVSPHAAPVGHALSGDGVWQMAPSAPAAATVAVALLILTEWGEFAELDWRALAAVMRHPVWLYVARGIANVNVTRLLDYLLGVSDLQVSPKSCTHYQAPIINFSLKFSNRLTNGKGTCSRSWAYWSHYGAFARRKRLFSSCV